MIKEHITSALTHADRERARTTAQINQQTIERNARTMSAQKKIDSQNNGEQKKLGRLINESGIINGLEQIQQELLTAKRVQAVLWRNEGTIRLVWGKYFELDPYGVPRLTIVKPSAFGWLVGQKEQVLHEWNQIEVHINTFRNEITIGKTVIMRSEWHNNRSRILDVLADAYLNPEKPPYR